MSKNRTKHTKHLHVLWANGRLVHSFAHKPVSNYRSRLVFLGGVSPQEATKVCPTFMDWWSNIIREIGGKWTDKGQIDIVYENEVLPVPIDVIKAIVSGSAV